MGGDLSLQSVFAHLGSHPAGVLWKGLGL
jgi:hypothetical protein